MKPLRAFGSRLRRRDRAEKARERRGKRWSCGAGSIERRRVSGSASLVSSRPHIEFTVNQNAGHEQNSQ